MLTHERATFVALAGFAEAAARSCCKAAVAAADAVDEADDAAAEFAAESGADDSRSITSTTTAMHDDADTADTPSDLILDRSCGPHVDHNCTTSEAAIPSIASISASQAVGRSAAAAICTISYFHATQRTDEDKLAYSYLDAIDCSFYQVFRRLRTRESR